MEPVMVDSDRAVHILRNLIANALRHGADPVRVVGHRTDERFLRDVRDSGDGVAPERLPSLFLRFVHDSDAALTEGSVGLGTTVARKLAVASGGDVTYFREGQETVFRLELPLYEEEPGDIDLGGDLSEEGPRRGA